MKKKKEYINPSMTAIEIDSESYLLTTSGELGEEVDGGTNAVPAYPGLNYFDYEEE